MSLKIMNKFKKIYIYLIKLNRNYNTLKIFTNFWVFLNKFLKNCKNFFVKIMIIVYEVLWKI